MVYQVAHHFPTHWFHSPAEDSQQNSGHGFTAMDFANDLTGPTCKLATGSLDVRKCCPLGFCWAFWSFFGGVSFVSENRRKLAASYTQLVGFKQWLSRGFLQTVCESGG